MKKYQNIYLKIYNTKIISQKTLISSLVHSSHAHLYWQIDLIIENCLITLNNTNCIWLKQKDLSFSEKDVYFLY